MFWLIFSSLERERSWNDQTGISGGRVRDGRAMKTQIPTQLLCQELQTTLLRFSQLDYLAKLHPYKRHFIVQPVPARGGDTPEAAPDF